MVNKKGVSPLVATILLISFAVVIITLVIIWGRSYIEEKAEKEGILAQLESECLDVSVEFKSACKDTSSSIFLITLENKANRKIDSFIFQFKEGGEALPVNVLQSIGSGEEKQLEAVVSEPRYMDSDTVVIIPQLKAGRGVWVPCSIAETEIKLATVIDC